jgi:hypothetical protein
VAKKQSRLLHDSRTLRKQVTGLPASASQICHANVTPDDQRARDQLTQTVPSQGAISLKAVAGRSTSDIEMESQQTISGTGWYLSAALDIDDYIEPIQKRDYPYPLTDKTQTEEPNLLVL